MKLPFACACVLPLAVSAQGLLQDDFLATSGTAYRTAGAPAPGAVVVSGDPWGGDFLRLTTDGVGSQNNRWTYPLQVAGAYNSITAEFDFRAIDSTVNLVADGFHFGLVPTSAYPSGDGPTPTAEEPNQAGYFAVALDLHPADGTGAVNDASAHWDGFEQVNHRAPTNHIHFINQQFHHARIELTRVGNSSLARLTLTPNVSGTPGAPRLAFEQIMPLLLPYENRVQFAGRTGGRDASMDIDNLSVQWDQPYNTPIPVASSTRLLQDFDRSGTTAFTASQHSGSWTDQYRPGVYPIDSGGTRGVFARLVHDNVNTSRNSISFHRAGPSLAASRRTSFDFRMASAATSADGLGVLFLRTSAMGLSGPGYEFNGSVANPGAFERPNRPGTLAVGFALYNQINDVSLHYETQRLNVAVNPAVVDLNAGVWHHADIDTVSVPGGLGVSITLTPDIDGTPGVPVTVLPNTFIPGVDPYDWRMQLGARTGGAFMNVDVDNIQETAGVPGPQPEWSRLDFSGGQSNYEVWNQVNADSNAHRSEILNDAGSNGNFLRLIQSGQTNSRKSLALDRGGDGVLPAEGMVTVSEFTFRAAPTAPGAEIADGMGFLLIPTATHGATGPGVTRGSANIGVEEPNFPGTLAMGIDLYPALTGVNDVSLHWNGAELRNVRLDPATQVDLDTNRFHHARLLVRWGAGESRVSLVVTPDILGAPGTPVVVVDDQVVPGLAPFEYRVEVAARSGGTTSTLDVDDLVSRTVPEASYTAWVNGFASLHPAGRDEADDADGDGQPNLLEYFAGGSPTQADAAVSTALDATDTTLRFTYRRALDRPDVTHAFEWTEDLAAGPWLGPDAGHVFAEERIGGDLAHDLMRVTLTGPDLGDRLYARIRVSTLP